MALLVLAMVGGGYFFLVAQAQAGVAAPAALLVVSQPVEVGHNDGGYAAATSGESLDAGSSVRTGQTGRATIAFPDGTQTRMSPGTTVTVQAAQLSNSGNLKSVTLLQKVGRTLSTVQHLAGGASFQVGGHSVTAEVRGTQFEVLVRSDGSNQIKVFEGTVTVRGQTTVTLTAGQQVDTDPSGRLLSPKPIQPDAQDTFPSAAACAKAAGAGNNPGTVETTEGGNLTAGQTSAIGYDSPGGDVTVVLCYPGSLMSLSVSEPSGTVRPAQGPSPVIVRIQSGLPGHYIAGVRAVQVPAGGEPFVVTFATNAACTPGNVDNGGVVRETLSNAQLSQSLSQSGSTGISIQVQGVSSTSARIHYSSTLGGVALTWTIDFYAATPNLGWVLTEVTVKGVNVTTQAMSRFTAAGASFSSIPTDFSVDRVYSCVGSQGGMLVIEGHRPQ